jgi:hypothetical protein
MLPTLGPNDKLKLVTALKEISTSMTRMESEKDLQKNVKNDICKELDLNKKVFSKLTRTYHKQNFGEEAQLHEEFETLYIECTLYETVSKPSA